MTAARQSRAGRRRPHRENIAAAAELAGKLMEGLDEGAVAAQLWLLDTISRNATLALFLMDERQHCTYMNPAAEEMSGFTLAEVQGRPLHEFVHHTRPDGSPYPLAECPIDRALPIRHRMQGEEVFVHRDGHFYPVAFTASPILHDGTPIGTVIEVRDITEQKRAEQEREALHDAERRARAEAEAAVRLRDELMATISHDLKNPLAGIRGYAQLLRRRSAQEGANTPPWMAESAVQIETLARKMTSMLDELLDLARLQAGQNIELDLRRTDLLALAREAVEAHQQTTDDHALRVEAAVREVVGRWDARRLGRVLDNLLSNAMKYSPEGGDVIVDVALEGHGAAWAVLAVRDHGLGIPPDDLPHIFERFRRGSNVADHMPGSGLGLASVRYVVERHGGRVSIESRVGAGTTVKVRLPLDPLAVGVEAGSRH